MQPNLRTAPAHTRISLVTTMTFVAIASTYACGGDDGGIAPQPPDPPRPTVVGVTPATAELTALGATTQLAAEVRDQNGRVMGGASVTWSSGTPAAGDTLRLTASAADANGHAVAGAVFEWATSDTAVAVVDDAGLVTAITAGAVTVTAISSDARGTADITVIGREQAALEALYRATDGPNWTTSDNWLTEAPLGDWHGVETDSAGRLVALSLGGNNLSGSIPPEPTYMILTDHIATGYTSNWLSRTT